MSLAIPVNDPSEIDPWTVMPAAICAIEQEAPGVHTFAIQLRDAANASAFRFQPGQFNMLYIPGVGEAAMSLSGNRNHAGPILHTIRSVGNVTRTLATGQIGTSLGIRGPFGSHWPIESSHGRDLIIVAGGIGLAPLRPVVYDVMAQRDLFGTVSLLIGTRTPADLLYEAEFQSWRDAGIVVQATVDRADQQWTGNIGVVTLLLQRLAIPRPRQSVLLTCGPEVMMKHTIQTALDRGVDESDIWLSLERNMNCAIGHCGHCQYGPHFICKDGPVLRFDRVKDLMEIDSL